ncbi:hypothetical protein HMPREF0972_01445 [Actinomyces sp. oral taxon 848 str. F0332]|nr:hypothetical protein HMPREF0972_01445 [Actinomyces sp. oral taxon 848 str. F0332]
MDRSLYFVSPAFRRFIHPTIYSSNFSVIKPISFHFNVLVFCYIGSLVFQRRLSGLRLI